MRAVAYRLRAVLRAAWGPTVLMAAVIAIVVTMVLAVAGGAARTSSAPDRYTDAQRSRYGAQLMQDSGLPRADELEALPAVARVRTATFLFGGIFRVENGEPTEPLDGISFAGSYEATGLRIVKGRAPHAVGEFVASRSLVEQNHLRIGDEFQLRTYTQEQGAAGLFGVAEPEGPSTDGRLVGEIDGPAELDEPNPVSIFTTDVLDTEPGISATVIAVELRSGASLRDLRSQVAELPDGEQFVVRPAEIVSAELRTAINAQSQGLWLVAIIGALASVVALGQLLTRQVRTTEAERVTLIAVGFGRRQRLATMLGQAAVPVVVGTLIGAAAATLASSLFPFGFARRVEPTPGFRIEWAVLALGAIGIVVALLGSVAVALALRSRRDHQPRPSHLTASLAGRFQAATATTGLTFAFTRSRTDSTTVRGSMVALVFGIAGVVAAFTFGDSLDRLVREPPRYGEIYDLNFNNGGTRITPEMRAGIEADRDVRAITYFDVKTVRVDGDALELLGMEVARGHRVPPLLDGRLPNGDDEIALGRLSAKSFGAVIGDEIELTSGDSRHSFEVTGIAVIPSASGNDGLGVGALVTSRGFVRAIGSDPNDDPDAMQAAGIMLRPGLSRADGGAVFFRLVNPDAGDEAEGGFDPEEFFGLDQPSAIFNVARVRVIPYLLAGVLAVLVVLTVGHVVLTSVRRRRHDLAVLSALGADRRWLGRAVRWQTVAISALPAILGIPLGLVLGSRIFAAFVDGFGALNDAEFNALLLLVTGLACVFIGVLAGLVARGRRANASIALRAD